MKVLVTGASGFLGQHLCAALCDDFEVRSGKSGADDSVRNYFSFEIKDIKVLVEAFVREAER